MKRYKLLLVGTLDIINLFNSINSFKAIMLSESNHMEDYKVEAGKKMVLSNRRDVQTMSYVYISAEKVSFSS